MTCAECREHFSARADDALAPDERTALDGHLATCAECRREWQRFAATVGLLRAAEPVRAPVGFVDRVLAAARPQPWHRRLARNLFVPWSVKIPLEAAAIVLVAGLAVMIVQRSYEMNELMSGFQSPGTERVATPEAPPTTAAAPTHDQPALSSGKPAAPPTSAPEATARREVAPPPDDSRDAPLRVKEMRPKSAPPAAAQQQDEERLLALRRQLADQQAATSEPAARPGALPAVRSTPPAVPPSGYVAAVPPAAASKGGEIALGYTGRTERPAELHRKAEPFAENAERDTSAQGVVPPGEQKLDAAKSRIQGLSARAAPETVELRLTVADRVAAGREIAALVTRLGGTLLPRRADTGALELSVPRDAYAALTSELGRVGTLSVVRQPAEMPGHVRVSVTLTE